MARHFFTLATLMLLVVAMYFLRPVLAPLFISFIIAVILMPAMRFLEKRGIGTPWAALMVVLFGGLFLIAVAFSIGWQVGNLMENSPNLVAKTQNKILGLMSTLENNFPQMKQLKLSAQYKQKMNESMRNTGAMITSSLGDILTIFAKVMLMPLYIYFLLSYRHFFRKFFHNVVDEKNERIDDVLYKVHEVTQSYLSGLFTVMTIVAGLNFIGLTIFKVPYALFFAVLASVLMLIPYVGVFIGSMLPVIFSLITHDSGMTAVGVAAWMWGVQILEGNFITPNLVGSKVSINPFFAMLSILLLSQLWGLSGLVLAMPFVAILKVFFDASPRTKAYGTLLGEVDHDEDEINEEDTEEEKAAKRKPDTLSRKLKKAIAA